MKCSRKEITLPLTQKSKGFQKEFELDSTLPDFLPNIERPVRVDAKIITESIVAGEDKVDITGQIVYGFLYVSDYKESIKFTEFVENFDLRSEIIGVTPETVVSPTFTCTGVSCKMLNPRKFLLKSKYDISYTLFDSSTFSVIDENSENCFFKTDTITTFNTKNIISREFCFSDTHDIGEGYSPITEIVTRNLMVSSTEYSVGDGYINIKANAILKILCLDSAAESEVMTIAKTISVSMILEDESIQSDSLCFVDIAPISFITDIGIDAYGENKIISSKFCLKVNVHCHNPEIITLATDVFAANTTNEQKKAELKYNKLIGIEKKLFTIEKIIETGEVEFNKLYDSSAMLSMDPSEITEKETICNGNVLISLLGETQSGVDLLDMAFYFTEKLPAADISDIIVRPVEISAAAIGNANVSLKIIAIAEYQRSKELVASAIESCDFTEIPESEDSPTVLVYYPSSDDDLWSVSKRYGIAPDTLKAGNSDRFDGEKIVSKVVLIPQRQV